MLAYVPPYRKDPVPWNGETIDGVAYPLDVEIQWTTSQLLDVGLYRVVTELAAEGFANVGIPMYEFARERGETVVVAHYPREERIDIGLVDAEDDREAERKGVPIGGTYRDGSHLMVRVR